MHRSGTCMGGPRYDSPEELVLLTDDLEWSEFRPPASHFHTAAVVPYCLPALGQQEGSLYSVQCGGIHGEFPGAYLSASTGWSVPLCAKEKWWGGRTMLELKLELRLGLSTPW